MAFATTSTTFADATALPVPQDTHQWSRLNLWLPIFFLCVIYFQLGHEWNRPTTEAEGFNRDAIEQQDLAAEGSRIYQMAFLGLGAVGGLMFLAPGGNQMAFRRLVAIPILLLYGWCLLSLIWADDAMLTFRRVFGLSCALALALGMAKHWRARDMCLFAFVFSCVALFASIATELAHGTFAPWAADYRFAGTLHPNTQAIFQASLAISAVALMRFFPNLRLFLTGFLVTAILFLILTKSRSGLAGCIMAFFSIWLLDTSLRVKYLTVGGGVIVAGTMFIGMLALGIDDPDAFASTAMMGREAESEQLTGRIPLWEYTVEEISKRPFTGYGFGSYWTEDALDSAHHELEWAVPNAHNSFIENTLSIGVIGTLLLIAVVFMGMASMASRRARDQDPAYAFLFGLAVFGLLNCFMESYMVAPFNFHPLLVAAPILRLAFYEE